MLGSRLAASSPAIRGSFVRKRGRAHPFPTDVPVCVDCLLDRHRRLGQGLDIAVEHTGAVWDGAAWQPAPELWDD